MKIEDKETLAKEHLYLAERLSKKMVIRFGHAVTQEDLLSFAMTGLAMAIETFDPERGVPFAAYATYRMKGEIYDGVVKASWLPRRLIRKAAFYKNSEEMIHYASEDQPPAGKEESAKRLGGLLNDIATLYVTTEAGCVLEETVSEPAQQEEQAARRQYLKKVNTFISVLPEKHRELIKQHFFEEVTLTDAAEAMGHSKSWASRVMRQALKQLRTQFDDFDPPVDDS